MQFRLSTLLLLVAGASLPFCLLKWQMLRKQRERTVIAEIKRVGGQVLYEWEKPFDQANAKPPGPAWLRKLLGNDFFTDPVWINLRGSAEITDVWLLQLAPLAQLEAIYLCDAPVTDDGIKFLARFKNLTHLSLDGTNVTDAGLGELNEFAELSWLHLSRCAVTDAGLSSLRSLTELRSLNLAETEVTDAGLDYLKPLSELRELWLPGAGVSDSGVADLQKALPRCEIIRCVR